MPLSPVQHIRYAEALPEVRVYGEVRPKERGKTVKTALEGLGGVLFVFIAFFLSKEYLPEGEETATQLKLIFVIVGSFLVGTYLFWAFLEAIDQK